MGMGAGRIIIVPSDFRRDMRLSVSKETGLLHSIGGFAGVGASPSSFSLCRSCAISAASWGSPDNITCRSSLKSRRISRRQFRNCRRNGERIDSISDLSCTRTGTMFSHIFLFKMLLKTARAASAAPAFSPALALPAPAPSASSSSWPARCVVKQMRISLQHSSDKPSLRVCPAGSAVVFGSCTASSASTNAASNVVTICAQTLNFWSLDIIDSMNR
mmetsp:Transcript_88812/g.256124  ORF Transcript_88812/g.256124 Transcript_88812/m.256124 type:complete len:217 (+) Transcript_88812:409-1059(+)